jgi:hypothetical protein
MFKAMRSAGGPDWDPPAPQPALVVKNSARLEISKIADEFIAADPTLSKSAALMRVYSEKPELAARAKAEQAFA